METPRVGGLIDAAAEGSKPPVGHPPQRPDQPRPVTAPHGQPAASPDPDKKLDEPQKRQRREPAPATGSNPTFFNPPAESHHPTFTRWIQAKGHSPARVPAERLECP